MSGRWRVLFMGTPLLLSFIVVALFVTIKLQKPRKLEAFGRIAAIDLIDQSGAAFGTDRLKGRIVVFSCMFTTCQGICPILNEKMKQLYERFSRQERFHLVSISVDPINDTPAQLKAWSEQNGIDNSRWTFLTGTREQLKAFLEGELMVGLPDDPLAHSDRFILMDGDLALRSSYRMGDASSLALMEADIFQLLR